jgi:hypothetical protein
MVVLLPSLKNRLFKKMGTGKRHLTALKQLKKISLKILKSFKRRNLCLMASFNCLPCLVRLALYKKKIWLRQFSYVVKSFLNRPRLCNSKLLSLSNKTRMRVMKQHTTLRPCDSWTLLTWLMKGIWMKWCPTPGVLFTSLSSALRTYSDTVPLTPIKAIWFLLSELMPRTFPRN